MMYLDPVFFEDGSVIIEAHIDDDNDEPRPDTKSEYMQIGRVLAGRLFAALTPPPLTAKDAISLAIEEAGGTGNLAAAVSGTTSSKDKGYKRVQRNLQRWRKGTRKEPELSTLQEYQNAVVAASGARNRGLDLAMAIVQKQIPAPALLTLLPPGTLEIVVKGEVWVATAPDLDDDGEPAGEIDYDTDDVRDRPIKAVIEPERNRFAMMNPYGEWKLNLQSKMPPFKLLDMEWMTLRFTPHH